MVALASVSPKPHRQYRESKGGTGRGRRDPGAAPITASGTAEDKFFTIDPFSTFTAPELKPRESQARYAVLYPPSQDRRIC
ncbi:hypothetical protein R1flu_012138 [Riccia fluitans]|uniref:Uncharacterized protein n=1 Tax=Riccia fluitans TaxID=41844 RepID=A0ABD1ZA36_9MARC